MVFDFRPVSEALMPSVAAVAARATDLVVEVSAVLLVPVRLGLGNAKVGD